MTDSTLKTRTYALKRLFDIVFSALVLLLASPLLLGAMFAVWLQDRHSPFYVAKRVGRNNTEFSMIKIRSMVIATGKGGSVSTSANDNRITRVGHFIRKWKIDEVSQFCNVLIGSMSVVGPRPQVRKWGVDLYTAEEMALLSARAGITDLASIVFSDEGDILAGKEEVDLAYNQLIRPWKSRLGLFYIENMSLGMDLRIIWLTGLAIVNKRRALDGVVQILQAHNADDALIMQCRRNAPLAPAIPPGASSVEDGSFYAQT